MKETKKLGAGYTDYNPFDAESESGAANEGIDILDSDVVGQAMVNEIDDALDEDSDDDEFGTFV